MTSTQPTRSVTALIMLYMSLLTTGCKQNDAATAPRPKAAASYITDDRGRYCSRREDCPAQWDAFRKKERELNAQVEQVRTQKLPHANSSTPDSQYTALDSGYQIATLFYALSGMPPDYEALASAASEEYRASRDEFRKRDLMQALRPKMDQQIAAYKDPENRYFRTDNPTGASVQHYDFKTSSFPVTLGLGPQMYTYFRDAPQYKLGYNNGNDFLRFAVADERRAKDIEAMVANGQAQYCESIFYLFIQEADVANNKVNAQVVRVALNDRTHAEIARF